LITREDVRNEISLADVVVAKLDSPNEELFYQINRPIVKYTLGEIIQGIKLFREEYHKKLALQMMFIKENQSYASEMAIIAEQLSPDEVQINTPLRPCAVQPLTPEDIRAIQWEFSGVKRLVTVYEASRPNIVPLNLKETLRRRPKRKRQV
jgi:wyosine [tRNA(Phe)-imidazoG37] synthetase (radical SAM superfamily)